MSPQKDLKESARRLREKIERVGNCPSEDFDELATELKEELFILIAAKNLLLITPTETSAVIIYPDGKTKEKRPLNGKHFTLDELKSVVGGYIEIVAADNPQFFLVVNEEGRLKKLARNPRAELLAELHTIVGTVLCCDRRMVK